MKIIFLIVIVFSSIELKFGNQVKFKKPYHTKRKRL